MNRPLHILSVETVIPGVLKLLWSDGYEGVVDIRRLLRAGPIFEPLQDPVFFRTVKVESFGHSIFWGEEGNEVVDFGCDRLREMAEDQAALLAKAG